jgi:hypothetical protein
MCGSFSDAVSSPDHIESNVNVVPTEGGGDQKNLHGLSPRANYTDRATTACRRSDCQLLRIKDATWSA